MGLQQNQRWKFCRDNFRFLMLQYLHSKVFKLFITLSNTQRSSNYLELCQTCQHISHWISSLRYDGKLQVDLSATFCIFIAINLSHIGTGINNVVHFKKLNSPQSSPLPGRVVLLERHFAASDWLTRKPNCFCFLIFSSDSPRPNNLRAMLRFFTRLPTASLFKTAPKGTVCIFRQVRNQEQTTM